MTRHTPTRNTCHRNNIIFLLTETMNYGENDVLVDPAYLVYPYPSRLGAYGSYPTEDPDYNPALLPEIPNNEGKYRIVYFPLDDEANDLPPRWFNFPDGWPGDVRMATNQQISDLPTYVNRTIHERIGWKLSFELGYDLEDYDDYEHPDDDTLRRFLTYRVERMNDLRWKDRMVRFANYFSIIDTGGFTEGGNRRSVRLGTDELINVISQFSGFAENPPTEEEVTMVLDSLRYNIIYGKSPKLFLRVLDDVECEYINSPFRGGGVPAEELAGLNGNLPNMRPSTHRPHW